MATISGRRVFITGGAGFIGTCLTERLVEHNEVTIFDSRIDGNSITHTGLPSNDNVGLVKGDVLARQELDRAIQGHDIVIHAAAMLGVKNVMHRSRQTLEVNYNGTQNVLYAALERTDVERVIVFSTSEVFGDDSFEVTEDSPSSLSSVQGARWCYAVSKLASEFLSLSYQRETGLPAVVIRPFNVFGPRRIGDYVIREFIVNALNDEPLTIYGTGTQIRSWCYISDLVDASMQCLRRDDAVGQAFNIGNPMNTHTIIDLARKVIDLCDSQSEIRFEKPEFSDIDIRVPSIDKAREVLDFQPSVGMREGLDRSVKWWRSQIGKAVAV